MNELIVKIENVNGVNVVSSRVVAEQLGKRHSDVLLKIKDVCNEREFSLVEYKDLKGENRPEALLTKDGFILLCMNYTGYNEFKRAYISEFNKMEEALKDIATQSQQQRLYERSPQELLADNAIALNKMFVTLGLNIPKEIIVSSAITGTQNAIGYSFPEVQALLPKQEEEQYHSASGILKSLGIKRNRTNETLVLLGLQEKGTTTMQPFALTDLGKKYGVERSYTNKGHQGYEIKWKESVLDYVKENIESIPKEFIK